MKRLFLISAAMLLFVSAKAQIFNPGFEQRHANGTPAYWDAVIYQIFGVDSTCVYEGQDSMRTTTLDAHTGTYAFQIGVATACGIGYSGNIRPTQFDSDSGFFDQRILLDHLPAAISFYYKMYSVQGDQGYAEVIIEDQMNGQNGSGSVKLGPTSVWKKATIPIQYTGNDIPGYMRLNFRIHNDTALHYGSRFLFDDISEVVATGIENAGQNAIPLSYPNPAKNDLFIRLNRKHLTQQSIVIYNSTGQVVIRESLSGNPAHINISVLPQGLYWYRVSDNEGQYEDGKMIKE